MLITMTIKSQHLRISIQGSIRLSAITTLSIYVLFSERFSPTNCDLLNQATSGGSGGGPLAEWDAMSERHKSLWINLIPSAEEELFQMTISGDVQDSVQQMTAFERTKHRFVCPSMQKTNWKLMLTWSYWFPAKNRALISTSDGEPRFLWLKDLNYNMTLFTRSISYQTRGRIRLVDRELFVKRIELADAGLYTCWVYDQYGLKQQHFNLTVMQFANGWIDYRNPVAWFKSGLVLSILAFFAIAWRKFVTFKRRHEAQGVEQARVQLTENWNKRRKLIDQARMMAARIKMQIGQ